MPDQSSAADEHALIQEITSPLSTLPDDPVSMAAGADFPIAFRGYDRLAVDAYVKKTSQLVAELRSTRSPEAAVRRALERVGEEITGILKRAHETAEQITTQSRREAEDRLVVARQEAAQIAAAGEQRVKDLDADADRIWAERARIVEDARELAAQLLALAEDAVQRFPPAEESADGVAERPLPAPYDADEAPYDGDLEADAVIEEPIEADDPDPTAALPAPDEGDDGQATAVLPQVRPPDDPSIGPADADPHPPSEEPREGSE